MKKTQILVVLVALVLAVTACGSGDGTSDDAADAVAEQIVEQAAGGEVDIDTDDGEITLTDEDGSVAISTDDDGMTMTADGEDGSFSATLGGGDLPADFPFPLPDEFEVRSSMEISGDAGTSYSAVIAVAPEEYDTVKAMYQSWLEDQGFTVDAYEMEYADGTKGVMISGEGDDADAFISISVEEVANDDAGNLIYETAISLTWDPRG